jgi:hypothetical protein
MRAMTDDELKHLFDAMRQAHAETRRHFDVVTEATRQEIRLVAESVALVGEKLEREATDIRQEMRAGFADTQANTLTALQSRVEHLEGSTH